MRFRSRRQLHPDPVYDVDGHPIPEPRPLIDWARVGELLDNLLNALNRALVDYAERERQRSINYSPPPQALPQPRRTIAEPLRPIVLPVRPLERPLAQPAPLASVIQPIVPSDVRWKELVLHPSTVAILGRRGAGKSATAYRLLELLRDRAAPCVVGPESLKRLLPEWIGVVATLEEAPSNSVVVVDEAYLLFHARASSSAAGRTIGSAINLSRQRNQTLIFVVQEAKQLDVNIVSQLDTLVIKELSEMSVEFERREFKAFTTQARIAFLTVVGDKRRWSWIRSDRASFTGLMSNELPSFWRPALSRAFADVARTATPSPPPSQQPGRNTGTRTPTGELAAKLKHMRDVEHLSYGEIARRTGLPKSTVWDLINGEGPRAG